MRVARAALLFVLTSVAVLSPAGAAPHAIRISVDPYSGGQGQHHSQVEPDSYAYGSTMVAAFQVSRINNGGAMNIGWATTKDDGATWTYGYLPGITKTDGGKYDRASDPSVAYDAAHGVWLISSIGIKNSGSDIQVPEVLTSRSTDGGLTWGAPFHTAGNSGADLDKNWIACDNTRTSPYYGHCYTTWDNHGAGNQMMMSTSSDGGSTWGAELAPAGGAFGLGGQPVVRPDGVVAVPYTTGYSQIRAFISTNGGASWNASTLVSNVSYNSPNGGLRSPPLPSAEISGDGTIYVAWFDCRFRAFCNSNDIVYSTGNGTSWSAPVRVPIDPVTSTVDHFIPGFGVDRSTSGAGTHLAVGYYMYADASCGSCVLEFGFGRSNDNGATWSFTTVGPGIPISWVANSSQGRMVGDYISTSFLGNAVPYPVWAHAYELKGGTFNQAMQTFGEPWLGSAPVVAAGRDVPVGIVGAHPVSIAPPALR